MKPLFSTDGLKLLEAMTFTRTLYAFDFDGTLSRIVSKPSEAKVSPKTARLMSALCGLVPVAIVSGRGRDDLMARVPFSPQYLVGNHGLEGLGDTRVLLDEAVRVCRTWTQTIGAYDFGPGCEIEHKDYSLALHFRRARNRSLAKTRMLQCVNELSPKPRVVLGKCVVNVLPEKAPHKGLALMDLMKHAGTRNAVFVGDDDTDEDVFAMPGDPVALTIRVGRSRSSRARFYIDTQHDIERLLSVLINFHERNRANGASSAGGSK
jgi:trehalose 6-phosphate phosphatase